MTALSLGSTRFVPQGERVIIAVKPHPLFVVLVPLGAIAGAIILAGIGASAVWALGGTPDAAIVWLCVALLILLRVLWQWLEWLARVYVLTERRIIRIGGVLRRYGADIPLDRLQNVALMQSIRERIFGLGTLGFATAGTGSYEAYWIMVARPHELAQKVRDAVRREEGRASGRPGEPPRSPILTIGLAGAVGAGKSTVARALADLGCVVSDSDRSAKEALARPDVRDQLVKWWGRRVLDADGSVDRKALADIVFHQPEARRRLERLTHPIVHEQRAAQRASAALARARAFVIDAPLLFEAGVDRECDAVIFVDAPREDRLARILESRGWTEEEVVRREQAQLPLESKRRMSDHILVNDEDKAALVRRTRDLLEAIERSRRKHGQAAYHQ